MHLQERTDDSRLPLWWRIDRYSVEAERYSFSLPKMGLFLIHFLGRKRISKLLQQLYKRNLYMLGFCWYSFKMVNGKWLPSAGKRQHDSVSFVYGSYHLPIHARSESINADSLNSNFLQLGRRSGGRPQRAVHPVQKFRDLNLCLFRIMCLVVELYQPFIKAFD